MKKIIALTVILCMIMALNVFADDTAGLQAAVMKVKGVTEIPDWLTEFDYRLSKEGDRSVWHLNWYDKDYEMGSLSASVTDDGDILDFYRYDYTADKSGEIIDIEEAVKTAELYAKTILGDDFAKMRITNADTIPQDSNSETFVIEFGRFENDIPVVGQTCRVGVNKHLGVCESYNGFAFDRETVFALPEKIISRDEAISSFVSEIGIELQYRVNRNYSDGTVTVYPAYWLDNGNLVIDAETGEKIEIPEETYNYNKYYLTSDMAAAGSSGGAESINLSPQEQEAVDQLGNLLTEKNAADILTENVEEFVGKELINSYLSKNGKDNYVFNLGYKGGENFYGSAMIDAQNGEILNFYFSTESFKETDKKRSEDEKAAIAEELARRLAGDKFAQTVAEIEGNSFEFVRQVNGMDFVGDGISINYDEKRDVIYSYSINWTEVENFPGTDDVMSACDAAKVIADRIGYELCYIGGRPVYDFGHKNYSVFSPYTGNPLKYNGTEYMDEKTPGYNDIAGHWSEKTVNKLLENNISLGGESFLPDQFITQKDFVKFVYYSYGFEDDADIEEFIKSRDLFETVNLKGMVTRNDASRVFAERLGYSELAEKVEIFVKPFADCNDEYAGYVAVCKAFGILSGDGDGNFRGNDGITRAESAVLIYNYICR